MFDFRFNTPNPFPESGPRKRFYASGMRGIGFSHKIIIELTISLVAGYMLLDNFLFFIEVMFLSFDLNFKCISWIELLFKIRSCIK